MDGTRARELKSCDMTRPELGNDGQLCFLEHSQSVLVVDNDDVNIERVRELELYP